MFCLPAVRCHSIITSMCCYLDRGWILRGGGSRCACVCVCVRLVDKTLAVAGEDVCRQQQQRAHVLRDGRRWQRARPGPRRSGVQRRGGPSGGGRGRGPLCVGGQPQVLLLLPQPALALRLGRQQHIAGVVKWIELSIQRGKGFQLLLWLLTCTARDPSISTRLNPPTNAVRPSQPLFANVSCTSFPWAGKAITRCLAYYVGQAKHGISFISSSGGGWPCTIK